MRKMILLLICCLSLPAYGKSAVQEGEYVRYLYDPGLQHLEIYVDQGPLPQVAGNAAEAMAALDRQGVILLAGKDRRTVTHSERMGSHLVKTAVTISPPGGKAAYLAEVALYVDGVKRVDSAIGPDDSPYEIFLRRIDVSPERIKVQATGIYPALPLDIAPLALDDKTSPVLDANLFSAAAAKAEKENGPSK